MAKAQRNYITFILGAGASVPYAFPDGEKLIIKMIKHAGDLVHKRIDEYDVRATEENFFLQKTFLSFENRTVTADQISITAKRISEELKLYRPTSIDSYLGNLYSNGAKENALYIDICKYLISLSIVSSYRDNYSDIGTKEDHWLHYLFNAILYELHRNNYVMEELPIKIITFNYDSLLEQKFRNWIMQSQLLGDDRLKESVINIFCKSIIHVYGQIGYVTLNKMIHDRCNPINAPDDSHACETIWASYENYNYRPDNRKSELAFHARKRIRIIGDQERENEKELQTAKNWLSKTKTLICTGYAFDRDNNIRLGLKDLIFGIPEIYGTLYDSGISLKDDVSSLIKEVQPLHGHSYSTRDVYFDGIKHDSHTVRPGYFAKFYNSTTQSFLKRELSIDRLCRDMSEIWNKIPKIKAAV